MANNFFKVKKGLNIDPVNPTTITPEIGDVIIDSTDSNKLKKYDGSSFVSLENKVAESGGTLTNGSIVTPSRLDVKKDTFANLQTYAATASNGQLVFATDLKQTYQIIDGALKVVGGAGGINYISNSDFESDTNATLPSGYARYANAAATAIPETGTGGSPNAAFTFLATTTTPLRGTKSALISKDANSRLGHGVSYNFTIDAADQAQILRISFDFNSSTNYADGDIRVYVYDVTNSRLIEVIDRDLLASTQGKFVGTFQSSPDSLSYRLIFHVASANALAYTVEIDNIIVGPQTIVKGAIVTDPEVTTLTSQFKATTTNPTFGTVTVDNLSYSREGKYLIIQGGILQTTAGPSAGSGTYYIELPNGLTADGDFITNAGSSGMGLVGSAVIRVTGSVYNGTAGIRTTTPSQIWLHFGNDTTSTTLLSSTFLPVTAADWRISFTAKIPIKGWSSNVVLSEDAGNREIVAKYNIATTAIANTGTTIVNFSNRQYDTSASVTTGASWSFSCPESGYYDVGAKIRFSDSAAFTAGTRTALYVFVNGVQTSTLAFHEVESSDAASIFMSVNGNSILYLSKGDSVDFRAAQTTATATIALDGATTENYVSIAKRSSPQTIAASEVVACRYNSNDAGQAVTSGVSIKFYDIVFDTHNSYNPTLGQWTCPQTGYYQFSACIETATVIPNNINNYLLISLVNTTTGISIYGAYPNGDQTTTAKNFSASFSTMTYVSKGDIVEFRFIENIPAVNLATSSEINYMSIHKVSGVS